MLLRELTHRHWPRETCDWLRKICSDWPGPRETLPATIARGEVPDAQKSLILITVSILSRTDGYTRSASRTWLIKTSLRDSRNDTVDDG
jgi:hypothetical protein